MFFENSSLDFVPLAGIPSIFSVDSDKVHFLTEGWK